MSEVALYKILTTILFLLSVYLFMTQRLYYSKSKDQYIEVQSGNCTAVFECLK